MTTDEALLDLLGPDREGDPVQQLEEALKESVRRRKQNSASGGAVIKALLRAGWSYTDIETKCGLARGTAHRWANPPEPTS